MIDPIVSGMPYGSNCDDSPNDFAPPKSVNQCVGFDILTMIVVMFVDAWRILPLHTIMTIPITPPKRAPTRNAHKVIMGPNHAPMAAMSLTSPAPIP